MLFSAISEIFKIGFHDKLILSSQSSNWAIGNVLLENLFMHLEIAYQLPKICLFHIHSKNMDIVYGQSDTDPDCLLAYFTQCLLWCFPV